MVVTIQGTKRIWSNNSVYKVSKNPVMFDTMIHSTKSCSLLIQMQDHKKNKIHQTTF